MKQELKSGWEYDWVSKRARRFLKWKAGVGAYVKRRLNKRNRKLNKRLTKEVDYD